MKKTLLLVMLLVFALMMNGCTKKDEPGAPGPKGNEQASAASFPIDFTLPDNIGNNLNLLNHYHGEMLITDDYVYYQSDYPFAIRKVNLHSGEVTEVVGDTTAQYMNLYKNKLYYVDNNKVTAVDLSTGSKATIVEVEAPKDYKQAGTYYSGYGEVQYLLIVDDYMFYTTKTGWHNTSGGSAEKTMALDLNTGATYGPLYESSLALTTDGEYIGLYYGSHMYRMALNQVSNGATINHWEDGFSYNGNYSPNDLLFGRNGFCYMDEDDNVYVAFPYSEAGKDNPETVMVSDPQKSAHPDVKWSSALRAISESGHLAIPDGDTDAILIFSDMSLKEFSTIPGIRWHETMAFHKDKLYVLNPNESNALVVYDVNGKELSRYALPYYED